MEIQVITEAPPKIPEPPKEPQKEPQKEPEKPKRPVGRPPGSGKSVSTADAKPKPPATPRRPVPPKAGPPDLSEWSGFIGGVVLKWVARAFVAVALKGINRNLLTPEEEEDLELDDESLEAISKPFAHIATKSKFMGKHGRMIIDSKDAIEAAVVFFMWTGRVRRVANKYNPKPDRRMKHVSTAGVTVDSGALVPEEQEQEQRPVAPPAFGHGYN